MTPVGWMAGGSLAAWLAVSAVAAVWDVPVHPELFWGMLGPLVSAVVTWVVASRTFAADPARLTGVMIVGFGVKLLVFGIYVAVALRPLGLRPVPFMVSFTAFFIALHVLEARFLRRLFAGAEAGRAGDDTRWTVAPGRPGDVMTNRSEEPPAPARRTGAEE